MYQNCGEVDFQSRKPDSGIAVEIRNGKGRVIANGGDLCLGADNEEQSRSVAITIATSSAAETYYCRRVRPSSDNSVWDCNESKSLSSGSEGQFGRVANSDDTRALLIYHSLSNGRYELEVSAEGGTEGDSPWTSVSVPVSFVVKDCSSATTTSSTTTSTSTTRRSSPTCGDRDPSQDGNQRYPCPEGWSYKTSANSLTSPSRTRCCTPPAAATCSDTEPSKSGLERFVCTGALVYKSSASKSRNPSESVCCQCRSGYEGRSPNCRCPRGQVSVGNRCVAPTCLDRKPSQNGNQRYPCPEGWSYKTSANSLTSPSRTRCCTPPAAATCGDTNSSKSGPQQFDCRGALVYKSSASKSRNPSESVCCECRSGYEGRSPNCRCPAGQVSVGNRCVAPTCLDRSPSQNGNQRYPCPEGWSYKTSANSLTSPSRTRCCTPPAAATCGDTNPSKSGLERFVCRGALVYKSSASKSRNPSESVCCECRSGYEGRSPNCRCPSGKEEVNGRCESICRVDQVRNSRGECECPAGQQEESGRCVVIPGGGGGGGENCTCTGASNVCSGETFNDSCGRARCTGTKTGTCTGASNVCSGQSFTGTCGRSCTGTKVGTCTGASNVCSGQSFTGSCGRSCTGTKTTGECVTCSDANGDGVRGDWYQDGDCGDGYELDFSKGNKTPANKANCCKLSPRTCLSPSRFERKWCDSGDILKDPLPNTGPRTKENCCRKPCPSSYVGTPPNCRCPSGQEEYGGRCVNECRADQVRNSRGSCVCPTGEQEFEGQCCERVSVCYRFQAGTACRGSNYLRDGDTFKAGGADFTWCYSECTWRGRDHGPEGINCGGPGSEEDFRSSCVGNIHGFPDRYGYCSDMRPRTTKNQPPVTKTRTTRAPTPTTKRPTATTSTTRKINHPDLGDVSSM